MLLEYYALRGCGKSKPIQNQRPEPVSTLKGSDRSFYL
jgi:hypothetical protein